MNLVEKAKRLLELENDKKNDSSWAVKVLSYRNEISKELCQAVVDAEMLIAHAIHLGYLGEGSTEGMAKDWLSRYAGEEKK